jgi:cell division septum initiation protein DivIVA
MFSRKSKVKQRSRAVDKADAGIREQVDELAEALDDARDAIARASASTRRKVADVTAETAKQAAGATKQAARSAAEAAREATAASARQAAESTRRASRRQAKAARAAAERLDSELTGLSRKAADRLFRERAKQRRKERRKQRRRLVYRGAGVAGLGVLVGWLTAPRRGQEARDALRRQAAKASEKGWEKVAEGRENGPAQPTADVTPLHDATSTASQPRTSKD